MEFAARERPRPSGSRMGEPPRTVRPRQDRGSQGWLGAALMDLFIARWPFSSMQGLRHPAMKGRKRNLPLTATSYGELETMTGPQ
jgi:hypothetical protein